MTHTFHSSAYASRVVQKIHHYGVGMVDPTNGVPINYKYINETSGQEFSAHAGCPHQLQEFSTHAGCPHQLLSHTFLSVRS
jgi:hypothetical protein